MPQSAPERICCFIRFAIGKSYAPALKSMFTPEMEIPRAKRFESPFLKSSFHIGVQLQLTYKVGVVRGPRRFQFQSHRGVTAQICRRFARPYS